MLESCCRGQADQVANQATFHKGSAGDGGDEASQEIVDHPESVHQLAPTRISQLTAQNGDPPKQEEGA